MGLQVVVGISRIFLLLIPPPRCLSCLCLACVVCGAVMVPRPRPAAAVPREDETQDDELEEYQEYREMARLQPEPRGLFRRGLSWVVGASLAASPHFPSFLVVMLADFLATVSLYIPYTHLPTLAGSRGLDTAQVGFLISAAGISNTCGRVTAGWLGDQDWLHPVTLSLAATSLSSVPLLLMTR